MIQATKDGMFIKDNIIIPREGYAYSAEVGCVYHEVVGNIISGPEDFPLVKRLIFSQRSLLSRIKFSLWYVFRYKPLLPKYRGSGGDQLGPLKQPIIGFPKVGTSVSVSPGTTILGMPN